MDLSEIKLELSTLDTIRNFEKNGAVYFTSHMRVNGVWVIAEDADEDVSSRECIRLAARRKVIELERQGKLEEFTTNLLA